MSERGARVTDLGGGVHQVTLPLPWALDHVHCYAIEDRGGWTIVDAGLGTPGTDARWRVALAALGSPRIHRLVLTHYHPDHLGNGAALAELTGAEEIVQGAEDWALARAAWVEDDMQDFIDYLEHHGMPAELARESGDAEGGTPVALATPTRLVRDGDVLDLGRESFRVLDTPGHADGHIALLGETSGRMFGGDVLLNEITPNVGRWNDSRDDPLAEYLETLELVASLDPQVVYPGHRTVIETPAARALEIRGHHDERLDACDAALRLGATSAYEVGFHLWGGNLGFHEQRFALAEAVAHLVRLGGLGRAVEVEPARWAPV